MRLKLILGLLALATIIAPVVADSLIWEPAWDPSSEISREMGHPTGYIRGTNYYPGSDGLVYCYYEIRVMGSGEQRLSFTRPIAELGPLHHISGDPFLPETWNDYGLKLLAAGRPEDAIYFFAEAAALSLHFSVERYQPPLGGPASPRPVDRVYWENLEAAYRAAGRHIEASTVIVDGRYYRHNNIYSWDGARVRVDPVPEKGVSDLLKGLAGVEAGGLHLSFIH